MRLFVFATLFFFYAIYSPAYAESALEPVVPRLQQANPEQGKRLFLQCRACHVASPAAKATIGPNLWEVVGRKVASAPGYAYSKDLEKIGGTWDYAKLNRYLWDPKEMAPEGRMTFPGLKRSEDRLNLIAYLRTLSETPVAIPQPAAPDSAGDEATYGNLPPGKGRPAVYFTCRACHALEQFTAKQHSREQWTKTLDEMVQKHGMAMPEKWVYQRLLDYLSEHYGQKTEQEDWQGLPPGVGREEVFYTCKTCHSLKMVTQQGLSRESWAETLEWMVEEQGMNPIEDPAVEERILQYLATHYGIIDSDRLRSMP